MRQIPWLYIESKHPVFRSGNMETLAFFPSENTQRWLRNHRCVWKINQFMLSLSIEEDAKTNGTAAILPSDQAIELSFYLGVNDLSYSQYTEIDDSPIHYTQHHYFCELDTVETPVIPLELKKSELREKLRPIALPKPFQKLGVLHILIKKPNVFFFDLENFVSRRILFQCEEKKYRLCYAIRFDYKDENMPSIVLDENEKVAFNEIPVENDEYRFLMTKEPINLTDLQYVNCYGVRISEENSINRLRCKVPKFSLLDLTLHPTYPHEQILLREIKY